MGWTYPFGATLKGIIAERTEGWESKDEGRGYTVKSTCLAKCFRGAVTHSGVLWSVWEQTFTNPDETEHKPAQRFIACDLLQCSSCQGVRSWGYKDMQESCGPFYWNCPEKYLKMVPVANQGWRDGVAEYHVKRREKRAKRKTALAEAMRDLGQVA